MVNQEVIYYVIYFKDMLVQQLWLMLFAEVFCIDTFQICLICDRTCEKGPCRASFQNRVITTIGKSRL